MFTTAEIIFENGIIILAQNNLDNMIDFLKVSSSDEDVSHYDTEMTMRKQLTRNIVSVICPNSRIFCPKSSEIISSDIKKAFPKSEAFQ